MSKVQCPTCGCHLSMTSEIINELADYKKRCQAWADSATQRDEYVHRLETKLAEASAERQTNAEAVFRLANEVTSLKLEIEKLTKAHEWKQKHYPILEGSMEGQG